MGRNSFTDKLSQMTVPKVYPLIRLGLKHGQSLNEKCFEIDSLSRKILVHDIPSLQMTAAANGLAALSSPLIHLRNTIVVYNKNLVNNQWEDYRSSMSDYEVMINPEIKRHSKQTETKEEECPILQSLYFTISRPVAIQVKFKDLNFIEKNQEFFGFYARVISHEIEHLHGVLPSNIRVCGGKCRNKYLFTHSDNVEKYYQDLCRDEINKLQILYEKDPKFKKQADMQNDRQEFYIRIVLGDERFNEYLARKSEAFRLDIESGKFPINTQDLK